MYSTKAISYHYMPFRNRYVGLLGIILVILISICRHTIIITYRAGLFHDSHHHHLNFSMPLFSETCSDMDHLDFEFHETCFSVKDKIDKIFQYFCITNGATTTWFVKLILFCQVWQTSTVYEWWTEKSQ